MSISGKIRKITSDKHFLLVLGMAIIYTAFFLDFTLTKHASFMTYWWDLGLYDHHIWSIMTNGDPQFPFESFHASQLIYLLIPLYSLSPNAQTLLMIQAPVVALGALPLYGLAKREIGSKNVALVLATAFLLYPPLHGISQFDFHLEAFLPTAFLLAAYFITSKNIKSYLLTIIFLLIITRYASVLVALFGLYILLTQLKGVNLNLPSLRVIVRMNITVKLAVFTTIVGSALAIMHFVILPAALLVLPDPFVGGLAFGDKSISLSGRVEYLARLYGPLGFVSIFSPSHLIMSSPWIGWTALTSLRETLTIYNQYPAYILPFLFIGAISSLKKISHHKKAVFRVSLLILVADAAFFIYVDPVFADPYRPITPRWPNVTTRDLALTEIIMLIPDDASVLTQNNLASHLSSREQIYVRLTDSTIKPDYLLIDRSHFSYNEPNFKPAPAQTVPRLLETGIYGLKSQCEEIQLYEKGYSGNTIIPINCPSS